MMRAAQVARALAAVVVVAVSACQTAPTEKPPSTPDITAVEVEALIPDYTSALESNPNDYVAFLKSWFQAATPEIDADDIVRYGFAARDKMAKLAAEKVIAGTQAFCSRNGGQIEKAPPALVCMGPDHRAIARLSVQVLESSAEQPGALQFTGESAAWIARLSRTRTTTWLS